MPSKTFFNLPPEKRNKLLRAAEEEFAANSLSDVSINRIIRAASIPRGSFYMYFRDKEELLYYILDEFLQEMKQSLLEQLSAREGDLFAAFYALAEQFTMPQKQQAMQRHLEIFRNTFLAQPMPYEHESMCSFLDEVIPKIDRSRLTARSEDEVRWMFELIGKITMSAIAEGVRCTDRASALRIYGEKLHILARGFAAPTE